MNFYLLLYSISIIVWIYYGYIYFKQTKNTASLFFFIFTLLSCIWFGIYFVFFSGLVYQVDVLLILSRAAYVTSIWVLYSFLYFIKNFSNEKNIFFSKNVKIGISLYLILIYVYVFTPLVVKDLSYDEITNVYRETFWILYFLHVFITLLLVPLLTYFWRKRYKTLSILNKWKLKNIITSVFLAFIFIMVFQLILPFFGIWLFEKEIIFVFLLFIISVIYTLKKYFFNKFGYGIWRIFVSILSLFFSALILFFIENIKIHLNIWYWRVYDYWGLNLIAWIVFYIFIYGFLSETLLWKFFQSDLSSEIKKNEQKISFITNIDALNRFLKKSMQKTFKINTCEIVIFQTMEKKTDIQLYFEKVSEDKIFINDIVFIESNPYQVLKRKIAQQLKKEVFIIFPLYDIDGNNIAIFNIWVKGLGDFYDISEINTIKHFTLFLENHLKYIKTYEQLQDFNVNLDTKIDEKTIEYNNLINKQKEFIAMISHEIRSPVASAIFQADSMLDDMKNWEVENMKSELDILNSILIKIWDLTSKLFAVQYYDTNNIELYLEQINVTHLLKNEVEVHTHVNEHIEFIDRVDKNIWFMKIDKIQFWQVIENLISNAVKFTHGKDGIVCLSAYKTKDSLVVSIEDNWEWFEWIEISELFDKYTKWNGNSIWLWMGLYLCKKIITMHDGTIQAWFSKEFSWAQFTITIPIK